MKTCLANEDEGFVISKMKIEGACKFTYSERLSQQSLLACLVMYFDSTKAKYNLAKLHKGREHVRVRYHNP